MNSPMHMVVNLAVGGNWPGSPDATTPWPAQMQVDYVHAYALPRAGRCRLAAPPPLRRTAPPPPAAAAPAGQVLTSPYPGATPGRRRRRRHPVRQPRRRSSHRRRRRRRFVFRALPWNAGHITDFQPGVDKLDISALYTNGYNGADPVADGYVSFVSDGAGGTKVLLDPDGPAGRNDHQFVVTDLDGVSPDRTDGGQCVRRPRRGGPPASPPPAGSAARCSPRPIPAPRLVGGAGADTLFASQGPDHLTGGAGADSFVFRALPWNAGHVTDFQLGVDKLDISALYTNGYNGTDPVADGYVSFVSDGAGGTKVLLDPDGPAGANGINSSSPTSMRLARPA